VPLLGRAAELLAERRDRVRELAHVPRGHDDQAHRRTSHDRGVALAVLERGDLAEEISRT
jgi:hypothetical protein